MSINLNFICFYSSESSSLNYISAKSNSASLSYSTSKSLLFGMKPTISAGFVPVLLADDTLWIVNDPLSENKIKNYGIDDYLRRLVYLYFWRFSSFQLCVVIV